ncbi:MAG: CMD domain-containing protein [Phyllobacterium sp.]
MSTIETADVIDSVLDLDKSPSLRELRDQRAKLKHFTQSSYVAALHPTDPHNLSYAERAAFAARMAALWKSAELVDHYKDLLAREGGTGDLLLLVDPAWMPAEDASRLATVLRHVDLVTTTPKQATRASIEALQTVGLDERDIVTLAGLIAFVNYQILVVAGLKMLRDN